ncbi:uncharacterized protein N7498_007820 [Penicillium cinerascens]|uniref:Glutathione synthetase n=1 Tax=Penicillium cinerascens TaxID=70096 RepID=A0A9W9JKP3_9EURO|nr:uncharacterized protein N7498_007820 [Penicillium cinerascens]KAJ5198703.1 hypothetical protein N7498_007820 [Penicillium cinerascens]
MTSPKRKEKYPPDLNEEQMFYLVTQIKDWQINHGSLLKLVESDIEHSVLSQPVGVACFPTLFPRARFQQALGIQEIYNRLYCSVAEDETWILDAIRDLIPVEPLAGALWGIHQAAKKAGSIQDVHLGIFRSDYMLHLSGDSATSPKALPETTLKQIEFNSFSCAGASHANKVANMHRYLTRKGVYTLDDASFDVASLPENKTIRSLASALALAHKTYGRPRSKSAKRTAVLFIVQPYNFNIADERPIEYALWNREEPVPAYRLDWGPEVLQYTRLTENNELLFQPPWLLSTDPLEISVVYLRAGYEAEEYNLTGYEARLQLEKSAAIKCPSILGHLTTFKKVQQALTLPGALERFLSTSDAAAIRETFVHLYPLDETEAGLYARSLVRDQERCVNYILKPSLEGGGNNVYGEDIPGFLASVPESQWSRYILMERIDPPISSNLLMSSAGISSGDVVSELGILGCCLWKANPSEGHCDMLHNSVGGWTFKTKYAEVNEMSVVKGYGCFDTPRLVDT